MGRKHDFAWKSSQREITVRFYPSDFVRIDQGEERMLYLSWKEAAEFFAECSKVLEQAKSAEQSQ